MPSRSTPRSTHPHAKLLSVDASAALLRPGVVAYFGANDIPGGNDIGAVVHDEEVFASDEVHCVGQVIGVIVAETQVAARTAAASGSSSTGNCAP